MLAISASDKFFIYRSPSRWSANIIEAGVIGRLNNYRSSSRPSAKPYMARFNEPGGSLNRAGMPQDYITAEEHVERRQKLDEQLVAARAAFDETIELDDDDGKASRDARWNVEHLELRKDANDRRRGRSIVEEQRQAEAKQIESRKQQAADVVAFADAAIADARKAEALFQPFLSAQHEADESWLRFDNAVRGLVSGRLGYDHPRFESISLALSHRFEGPSIVGRMQAASVPGLELVDDPIAAMLQHGNSTLSGVVGERLNTVLRQAALDIPELREARAAAAKSDTEADADGGEIGPDH